MAAEVDQLCDQLSMNRSRFIRRGIQLAIDEARKRLGPVASGPSTPSTPGASLAPSGRPTVPIHVHDEEYIPVVRRGDTTWFDLESVCNALQIDVESLWGEIDPEDDVLQYQGKTWIDQRGLAEARTLCRSPELADALAAWAKPKLSV